MVLTAITAFGLWMPPERYSLEGFDMQMPWLDG